MRQERIPLDLWKPSLTNFAETGAEEDFDTISLGSESEQVQRLAFIQSGMIFILPILRFSLPSDLLSSLRLVVEMIPFL